MQYLVDEKFKVSQSTQLLKTYWKPYYTKILEVNLFAFAYRLFHRDFSPINGTYCNIVIYHITYFYEEHFESNMQFIIALLFVSIFV